MDRASSWGKADLQGRWGQEQHNCVFIKVSTHLLYDFAFLLQVHHLYFLVIPTPMLVYCFVCACECRVHMYVCIRAYSWRPEVDVWWLL